MYPAYLSSFLFFLGRFASAAALVAWDQVFRVFLLPYEGPSVLELCPLWVWEGGGGDAHCRLCRTGKGSVPATPARETKILSTCFPTRSEAGGSIASYHIQSKGQSQLFSLLRGIFRTKKSGGESCYFVSCCPIVFCLRRSPDRGTVEVVGAVVGFVVTIFNFKSFSRYKNLYKIIFMD